MAQELLAEAARRLAAGELVAYPTETVFGIAALPGHAEGMCRLLDLKERSLTAGVPLIAAEASEIEKWIEDASAQARTGRLELQEKFWPGALSIVFSTNARAKQELMEGVFGLDGTLAARVSSCDLARDLARTCGGLITATSANPKGRAPAETAAKVRAYFPEMFICCAAGAAQGREPAQIPSTLIDVRSVPFKILREGAVARNLLAPWLG